MTRKTDIAIAVGVALLLAFLPAAAGRRTASLAGKVSDNQGFPLSGTVLQASSPALLNVRRFITADSGRYVFPDLAPGIYTITVEKAEFKTVKAEGIVLDPGATLSLDFKMEPSAVEEEVVVRTPDPGHERSSARLATVLDRDLLTRLPLPRDLASVLSLVPGVVLESGFPVVRASIHGAPVAATNYWVDGANLTDPLDRTLTARVDVDAIEEVVVETAALPVDSGPGQGAAVNIIHRSGGNVPYADLGFYLTSKGMSRPLWSSDELNASRLVQPRPDMANFDTSFTAGGPILHDMGWFFSDVRLNFRGQDAPFQSWKDPANYVHSPYTWSDREFYGLFKMSVFATKEFRGSLEASFARAKEPVYAEDLAWNRPDESTRNLDLNKTALLRANVAYTLDDRTVLDFNGGYVTGRETLPLNDHGSTKASYSDLVTGRIWGSGPYNDDQKRKRLTANLSLTRFQDRLLGADHQFTVVADYETAKGLSSSWKPDNLVMYYVDGSPYTFGQAVSPSSGNTVGKGQIGFSVIPGASGGTLGVTRELRRLGVSAGDTLTIGRRVALSLGLRFDHSDTDVLAISKAAAGNAVSVGIGTSIIEPLFGFNPFAAGSYGSRDSVITWDSFSPRVGLSIDLFGRGRTFLRGSYSKLPEELGLGYIRDLDPVALDRIHQFYWYDENGDGKVDDEDVYQALPENYSIYSTLYTLRVDPALKAPVTEEWTAGLDHEVVRDFSLAVRYISRTQQGGIGDVLYDPSRDQAYYRLEDAPADWWVPFQTTIPATDAYPATDVTIYLQSTTSPLPFDRIQAVPELTSRYRGLEFSFRKRMSHNWQLSGSAVWSRTTGRSWLAAPLASGLSTTVLNPNSFINVPEDSLSDLDRPLAIRLMGTVRFKHDIFVSLLYRYTSGLPWARTVTIIPPSDWAAANGAVVTPVTVYLEKPGTRRYPATQSTDLRVEKEILRNGRARWTFYLDVLNVLGNKSSLVDGNDGTWIPSGEGSSSGTHTLSPTYGRALVLNGARTFVLSMKFGL